MEHTQPSYPTTASAGYSNIAEAQEKDLRISLMKRIDVLKEKMNKYLLKIQKTQTIEDE